MSDLAEVLNSAIEKSDKCRECGVITARIGGDSQAHWCCNCGAKLHGNHPYATTKMPAPAEVPSVDQLWNNDEVMALNAELGLTLYQMLRLVRAALRGEVKP